MEKTIFGMDLEDAKWESKYLILVQNKISAYFENSRMDDRMLKFDDIANEIDHLRSMMFEVKLQCNFLN